ncbi:MAG: hypothetical protein ABR511_11050 [Acidimicrobiales bacterium]
MTAPATPPDADELVAELESRVRRYPPERYPVQHATAQFHLGVVLADAGRPVDARRALDVAVGLFPPDHLPVEHAKAANARGAVARLVGDLGAAAADFRVAAGVFAAHGLAAEEGAARFNLGLVERESGHGDRAVQSFLAAQGLLGPVPAVRRELGAAHLAAGDVDAAVAVLEEALGDARASGDRAALGAAANLAGLAHLAADRPAMAVRWFATAAAADPRGVRPDGYAVAKANLALAHERAGDAAQARLSAAQALGSPAVPAPAAGVATGVLDRLGRRAGDVMTVVADQPPERRRVVLQEELARWADAGAAERRSEAGAWVAGLLQRPEQAPELVEAWLASLLELPPRATADLVEAVVAGTGTLGPEAAQQVRSWHSRAMVTFHPPQWMRLRDIFAGAAARHGGPGDW